MSRRPNDQSYYDQYDGEDREEISQRRPKKKLSKYQKKIKRLWAILGIEVVFFLMLLVLYGFHYTDEKFEEINYEKLDEEELNISETIPVETRQKYTTIALFGLDARDITTDTGNRSDTIIIASIDNDTKEVRLLSVYRDTYMEFSNPSGNYDGCYTKITHAYAYGGAKGSIATLNKNLDLPITDYVTVNFLSLADIVDDLGGITVNVTPDEMNSVNIWLPETAQIAGRSYKGLYETGDVTLDGLQAVTYCRIRNIGAGDIDRSARQREVLSAILDKAKQSNLSTLNKILDDVLPEISTSLTRSEIVSLMKDVLSYELTENEGFPFTYHAGMYYDEIAGQDLSIIVGGDMKYNAELAHQFLYGSKLGSTAEDGSSDYEEANYVPSQTVEDISNAIVNKTGVYKPEDPELRGQY